MAKKDRISLQRSEAFESVDDALTTAMLRLDASNQRVENLLGGDRAAAPPVLAETPEVETPRVRAKRPAAEASAASDA